METLKRVVCPENEGLASYMLHKRKELLDSPKGLSENVDSTLSKAYNSVCASRIPIQTLKEFSQLKGVGNWILKLMQEFFDGEPRGSEQEELIGKGKRAKKTKRYLPQRNSVAYALLITLYRGTTNGNEFMGKQELIDATEASGLSRAPVMPEKGKGKPSQYGSSAREWYSGWSCMKTLITKGLVVKSSCPAKYMLTEEGQDAARECLLRSRLDDPKDNSTNAGGSSDLDIANSSDVELARPALVRDATVSSHLSRQQKQMDVPPESLERFMQMGYTKEQVLRAFAEVSQSSHTGEISSLWPAILCRLREDQVYGVTSGPQTLQEDTFSTCTYTNDHVGVHSVQSDLTYDLRSKPNATSAPCSFSMGACSSSDNSVKRSYLDCLQANRNFLSIPPLKFGERFEDLYEVILILDDREQFAASASKGRKLIDAICKEHKIKIWVRRLPVGDGIWIAHHKYLHSEYVLDFIVERKKVDDLRSSIRDNRYRDQKLRLLRCGLKKLIYLVEGDPNSCEAAESIKSACFTTEILEGFDVQRASSLRDTIEKYGYLTRSITKYYSSQLPEDLSKCASICPAFNEFIKRCEDLEKMTVSDVFAIQLMQVPQVTEEVAIAVLNMYPTVLSLARAYSLLEGDVFAQEEMLRKQSNNAVSATASRNIFRLIWGNDT